MKAILIHCKRYKTTIGKMANRPSRIVPEVARTRGVEAGPCVLALICVETEDTHTEAKSLVAEIERMVKDVGHKTVVLLPFAHLSASLAPQSHAVDLIHMVETRLQKRGPVLRDHFGSHKALVLESFGHPGNVRYRSKGGPTIE